MSSKGLPQNPQRLLNKPLPRGRFFAGQQAIWDGLKWNTGTAAKSAASSTGASSSVSTTRTVFSGGTGKNNGAGGLIFTGGNASKSVGANDIRMDGGHS